MDQGCKRIVNSNKSPQRKILNLDCFIKSHGINGVDRAVPKCPICARTLTNLCNWAGLGHVTLKSGSVENVALIRLLYDWGRFVNATTVFFWLFYQGDEGKKGSKGNQGQRGFPGAEGPKVRFLYSCFCFGEIVIVSGFNRILDFCCKFDFLFPCQQIQNKNPQMKKALENIPLQTIIE